MNVIYKVDSDAVIQDIGGSWDFFAKENEGPHLLSSNVVGTSLWTYIIDSSTRKLYQDIIVRVLDTAEPVNFRYRCDSPGMKRFMNMNITKEGTGVLFNSSVERVETRSPEVYFSIKSKSLAKIIKRCSICTKLNDGTGWKEIGPWLSEGNFDNDDINLSVMYCVCEKCSRSIRTIPGRQTLYTGVDSRR
ncbi:hypothetical protein [Limisalsivibrio acetivorans]|uniref:hypothetical protein n=1 Tax=Limisalsivibrio acetivorans TaxID=1304888 RepID=UPI0003B33878|nr:hypothetical protein [Limisalsivibrio acetivorans]